MPQRGQVGSAGEGTEGVAERETAAPEARRRYEKTGEVVDVPVLGGGDPEAVV
ncbi:hypothetical protein ACF061_12885 [Streptomyces sp. NPDC015220]|uniref:hypothetical protein n=1 Tax=Streptomyces sp. NPDC015220 TaxID=3364947 RepID=UPI0036F7915C